MDRRPWRQMVSAAITLDVAALPDAAAARALLQCVPTPDEAKLLDAFRRNDASLAGLAEAELFALDLMTVCGRL